MLYELTCILFVCLLGAVWIIILAIQCIHNNNSYKALFSNYSTHLLYKQLITKTTLTYISKGLAGRWRCYGPPYGVKLTRGENKQHLFKLLLSSTRRQNPYLLGGKPTDILTGEVTLLCISFVFCFVLYSAALFHQWEEFTHQTTLTENRQSVKTGEVSLHNFASISSFLFNLF